MEQAVGLTRGESNSIADETKDVIATAPAGLDLCSEGFIGAQV
jgi:hypothetical protein